MSEYKPDLDDMEILVGSHPERFDSPLQTQRSIAHAKGGHWTTQEATAEIHYDQYLANGGTPIGPNGEMPPPATVSDQTHGDASCDCEAATPCCIKKIKFSCSHGTDRMILPKEMGDDKECHLVLVADKDPRPGHDMLTIKLEREPKAGCTMPQQLPLLTILGKNNRPTVRGDSLTAGIAYGDNQELGGSDLARFARAMKITLWDGDIDRLGKDMPFEVQSCAGKTTWGSTIRVFPKLDWSAKDFSFEVSGKYDTAGNFTPGVKFTGGLEGNYGSSTFKIAATAEPESDAEGHTKSMIPFLDGAMKVITARTKGGNTQGRSSTASSIAVKHKFTMADAKFSLAEDANDHSAIGVDANITIGYQPLFGVTAEIDLLDVLITAAEKYPAAMPLARALRKGRDALNDGLGDKKEGPVYIAGQVYVKFIIGANIGNSTVTLTRKVGEDQWSGSGAVGGDGSLEVKGLVQVDARLYLVKGTASASASAASKITATLKTLTPAEMQRASGSKFNAKVEWNGVSVKYGAEATVGFGGSTGGGATGGDIVVFTPEVLFEENF